METKNNNPKTVNSKSGETKYGYWSMLATIVGIVVGIGIFFKNQSIADAVGGNELLGIIAWLIGAAVIMTLAYLFMEIYSAKSKDGSTGSITEWSKSFLGQKGGVMVSSFWQYIYLPVTLLVVATFSTDMIANAAGLYNTSGELVWSNAAAFMFYFGIVVTLIMTIPLINATFSRPSQVAQGIGTVIKFIPLVVVLVGTVAMMFVNPADYSTITTSVSSSASTSTNWFLLIMAALPAVLFAFDGFLAVSQLQNQGKEKNTYKKAMISGVGLIALVYILIAIFSFTVGSESTGYSVSAMLAIITGGQEWIQILLLVIIFISGVTGINGFTASGNWNKYSLSKNELISDRDGKYLELNKYGIPQKSGRSLWFTSLCWTLVVYGIGGIVMVSTTSEVFNALSIVGAIDSLSNTYIIIAFFLYGAILVGGIVNRKTEKVKVEKVKFFVPLASVVSLFLFVASSYSLVTTMQATIIDPSNLGGWFMLMVVGLWVLVSFINYYSVKLKLYPSEVIANSFKVSYDWTTETTKVVGKNIKKKTKKKDSKENN